MNRKIFFLFLLVTIIIFNSCKGLIEYIREAQQRGLEQNESSYRVVFNDDDPEKPAEKPPKRKKETKSVTKSENYTYFEKKWKIQLEGNEDLELLNEIDSWIGTPYKYGGNSKQGTDCSGMVLTVYKKLYNIDTKRSAYELWKQSAAVKRENLQCGDLVFFKINMKQVSHVGIYIASGYFVHASSSRGVIFDHLDTKYYAERFATGGRISK